MENTLKMDTVKSVGKVGQQPNGDVTLTFTGSLGGWRTLGILGAFAIAFGGGLPCMFAAFMGGVELMRSNADQANAMKMLIGGLFGLGVVYIALKLWMKLIKFFASESVTVVPGQGLKLRIGQVPFADIESWSHTTDFVARTCDFFIMTKGKQVNIATCFDDDVANWLSAELRTLKHRRA